MGLQAKYALLYGFTLCADSTEDSAAKSKFGESLPFTAYKACTCSTIATVTPECSAQLYVTMGQIKHCLWQTGCLHNASNFDRTLTLNELAHGA